jgi:hypothetical protein
MKTLTRPGLLLAAGTLLTLTACQTAAAPAPPTVAQALAGECAALPSAAISGVTGTSVRSAQRGAFPGAGGTCGNYTTESGEPFLGVNVVSSASDFGATVASVPSSVYPVRSRIDGLGEEAIMFTDQADKPLLRYLVARDAGRGVVLFPLGSAGRAMSNAQLQQLAALALARS